ncbi:hypothetical protein AVEN_94478-1 [Araneus ventricosus]|uniref:Uncharacterized protein n=1 Tax=Araneus ventricosus TaxID=182803 RepID=A0A4Y2QHL9_ARAVE|nr:hypothetical protein AVEN_94478-1 [Araneus ventricosus]
MEKVARQHFSSRFFGFHLANHASRGVLWESRQYQQEQKEKKSTGRIERKKDFYCRRSRFGLGRTRERQHASTTANVSKSRKRMLSLHDYDGFPHKR